MFSDNLKYLRKKHGETQQQLAAVLGIPRTTLTGYELGNTEPGLTVMLKLAKHYGISIEDLVNAKLSDERLSIIKDERMKILAMTVDESGEGNIELVSTKAEAGYIESFEDPEFIRELPKLKFPNIKQGTYRAFEIRGDSMLPMPSGSIVICSYVERLLDVKDNQTYVIVSKTEGVVYKRVKNNAKAKKLILISDNELYQPYGIDWAEVSEIWQYYAHLSFSDIKLSFNQMIEDKLNDIQRKLTEVHSKLIK